MNSNTENTTIYCYLASADNCPALLMTDTISNPSLYSKKNVIQINKNFDELENSYYLCSECENLERFNAQTTIEQDNASTIAEEDNCITGSFQNCKEANNTFSFLPKIEKVDFKFPVCVKATENFRGCENIKDVTVDYPKCVVINGEFAGCKNLKNITISSGLSSLVCGKQAFEGCENLTMFNNKLPRLLCGVNMFKGCKFKATTVEETTTLDEILESLPTITINGVKLNDFGLSDEEVNEHLEDWIDGYTVTRKKSKGVFQIKENENETPIHEISFSDFGIIDLDVAIGDTEQTMDMIAKGLKVKTKFTRNVDKAIKRGWKIRYNGKIIEK